MQPEKPTDPTHQPDPDLLQRLARTVAARVLRNPVLAEEAGERAVHKFFILSLSGRQPQAPEAWVRVVARRLAWSLRRRRRCRQVALDMDQLPLPDAEPSPRDAVDALVQRVDSLLTPRQHDAVQAAISSRSMRDAARNCRMSPRDLRRSLGLVSEKFRARLAQPMC